MIALILLPPLTHALFPGGGPGQESRRAAHPARRSDRVGHCPVRSGRYHSIEHTSRRRVHSHRIPHIVSVCDAQRSSHDPRYRTSAGALWPFCSQARRHSPRKRGLRASESHDYVHAKKRSCATPSRPSGEQHRAVGPHGQYDAAAYVSRTSSGWEYEAQGHASWPRTHEPALKDGNEGKFS